MLQKIEIEGFKSIKKMSLQLSPINILIGSNGVGKSNFVSFFKLVNNLYEQNLESYSMRIGVDRLLYYGQKHTSCVRGFLDFGSNAYRFELAPTQKGSLMITTEESIYSGRSDTYPRHNLRESTIKDSKFTRDAYLRERFKSYKIYHFHDTEVNSQLRSQECSVDDNSILKADGGNLPSYLYLMQQKYPKALRRIEMGIRSVMPYFDRFVLAPRKLDPNKIKLEWRDSTDIDKYFDALDLSDGSLRFIALATLLMQPELPQTIIIDEPELGLHPVAIAKLGGMIKSAAQRGCQMIISTQSVELINHFNPEDIITVDRRNGQSVFNRLDSDHLRVWLEDYSLGELWDKSIINGQPSL